MMEYNDEKIISLKMEAKEQIAMSLEHGYYINGKKETFVKEVLFDERISIYLPETFVDMPSQVKELKYPSAFRPQIIKTTLDSTVNFAFNLLGGDGLSGKTEEVANSFSIALKQTNPSIIFYDFSTEEMSDGNKISIFDFTSFGLDQQVYNLMGILFVNGKILQATFNCLERDKDDWKDAAKEVFLSVEINRKGF